MAITAAQVNELRQRTGLGMMECKKALQENDGDVERAIKYFAEKGVKTSLLEREAGEGRINAKVNAERSRAVAVEVKCNTDFTANSDPVKEIADIAADALLADPDAKVAELQDIKDKLVAVAQRTGENVQIGKTAALQANAGEAVGAYIYTVNHKTAVLVKLKGGDVPDELPRDIGLHVMAFPHTSATRDKLDPSLLQDYKKTAAEEAAATGKPANIIEKIVEGKIGTFYKQHVLLDQDFALEDKFKGTVGEMLKKNGAELVEFVKFTVG